MFLLQESHSGDGATRRMGAMATREGTIHGLVKVTITFNKAETPEQLLKRCKFHATDFLSRSWEATCCVASVSSMFLLILEESVSSDSISSTPEGEGRRSDGELPGHGREGRNLRGNRETQTYLWGGHYSTPTFSITLHSQFVHKSWRTYLQSVISQPSIFIAVKMLCTAALLL